MQAYLPCLIRGLAGCAVPALPACDCPLLHQRRKSSYQWRGGWTGFDPVIFYHYNETYFVTFLQVNRSEQIPLRLFTPGPVSSLATSPSGSYLAAAVQESITIWQIGTGGPAVQFCANIFTLSYLGPYWLCCPGTTSL